MFDARNSKTGRTRLRLPHVHYRGRCSTRWLPDALESKTRNQYQGDVWPTF